MSKVKDISEFIVWSYQKTDLEVKFSILSFMLVMTGAAMDNALTRPMFLCGLIISGLIMFKLIIIDPIRHGWNSYQQSK